MPVYGAGGASNSVLCAACAAYERLRALAERGLRYIRRELDKIALAHAFLSTYINDFTLIVGKNL